MSIDDATPSAAIVASQAPEARPVAELGTDELRQNRPTIVGPEQPQEPYPILLSGPVQRGFGRGGKDLGCPTANLPDESIEPIASVGSTGVYYGFAQVIPPSKDEAGLFPGDVKVLPMVMSMGWNPFYNNKRLTVEIHVMHNFDSDFYGYVMRAVVLGYIRPELNFISREALIDDIELDKRVAVNSLNRPAYQAFRTHSHFAL